MRACVRAVRTMQKMPGQVRLSLRDNKTSVLLREVVTLKVFQMQPR
jgi:hypothetical protein